MFTDHEKITVRIAVIMYKDNFPHINFDLNKIPLNGNFTEELEIMIKAITNNIETCKYTLNYEGQKILLKHFVPLKHKMIMRKDYLEEMKIFENNY